MTFAAPALLIGLLVIPALVGAYVMIERRRRRNAAGVVAPELRPAVVPRALGWRRHVPVAGGLAASALLVAALAKPETTRAVPVQQAKIEVLTDRSGSMLATDVAPNRLTAARSAAAQFLQAVPSGVRVGLIAFNQDPTVLQSPTADHDAVLAAVRSITAAGTTATGDAIAAALEQLKTDDAPSAIVLLSDGESVRGQDVLAVARAARAAKVPIYTVSLGTAGGTITTKQGTSSVPPDTATMRQVASITGGRSYDVSDARELSTVYKQLGSKLATRPEQLPVSSAFAGGALLVLVLSALGSARLTGRPF